MKFKQFLLTEGKFEHETTAISRAIIRAIKDNFDKLKKDKGLILVYGKVDFPGIQLAISAKVPNIAIGIWVDNMVFSVRGSYVRESDLLKVFIHMSPENINELIPRLKNTIRHELEHSGQGDLEGIPNADWKKLSTIIGYYTDPREVAAFVSGFYKQAKTTRKPFSDIVNDYLELLRLKLFNNHYSTEEAERAVETIRKTWLDYQKKRFTAVNV